MPSGNVPTYAYRPSQKSGDPFLRSCSSLRARLFAGGTYFRSIEPGRGSNLISVQLIEYEAPTASTPGDAVCVVTNYALVTNEVVTGPVTAEVFDIHLQSLDEISIDQLDQPAARARFYSISLQIAPPTPAYTELGPVSLAKLFSVPGKITTKLTPATPVFTPSDVVIMTPRRRVYRLVKTLAQPLDPMGVPLPTFWGWDIANLRSQVNAGDPWIEMLERSGPTDDGMGGPPIPNPNPPDVQDDGTDALVATAFAETRLSGGDGLPDGPNRENTGPMRSMVHVNYGEAHNGSLKEVNVVYEWVGSGPNEGSWKSY